MYRSEVNLRSVVYLMLYFYLVIESINGFLLMNGFFSIGLVYKFVVLAVSIVSVGSKRLYVFSIFSTALS